MKGLLALSLVATFLMISGCGGGGGDSYFLANPYNPDNSPTNVTVAVDGIKTLLMEWDFVSNTDHFAITEDPNASSAHTDVANSSEIKALSHSFQVPVHRINWGTTQYAVDACSKNKGTRLKSTPITVPQALNSAAIGYFKASWAESSDCFGSVMALSGDGTTLVVGAHREDSAATGVSGDDSIEGADDSGAAYLYTRSGDTWSFANFIKASNAESGDAFGYSCALNNDGNTLFVGARYEDGGESGIGGNQGLNNSLYAGAVYLY